MENLTENIDAVIESLQHPFFMMVFGLLAYFFLKWSVMSNLKKIPEGGFFNDQKDEMAVSTILGFLFIIWDDEALAAYYHSKGEEVKELRPWMYFFVGVASDNIYQAYQVYVILKDRVIKAIKSVRINIGKEKNDED